MKKLLLLVVLLTASSRLFAMLHEGRMLWIQCDLSSPIVAVYDIKKNALLKTYNTKDVMLYKTFSGDASKLYLLGHKFAAVLDMNSLELKLVQFLSDEDDVAASVDLGNGNKMDMPSTNKLTFALGVTKDGIAVYGRSATTKSKVPGMESDTPPAGKMEYIFYDVNKGSMQAPRMMETTGGRCCADRLLIPDESGSIRVFDPSSRTETGKLNGAYDLNAITESRKNKPTLAPGLGLSDSQPCLQTEVMIWQPDNTYEGLYGIYDMAGQKMLHTERVKFGELSSTMPVYAYSSSEILYTKRTRKAGGPPKPQPPASPNSDFSGKKGDELIKALEKFQADMKEMQGKQSLYTEELKKYLHPRNYDIKITKDPAGNDVFMSFDDSLGVVIFGKIMASIHDTRVTFYDMATKKLLYTIDLV